jgi:hypothetical protein
MRSLALALVFVLARIETPAPSPAAAAFERIKGLEGEWVGKSTKGWTDKMSMKVIARGSAVLATSDFEAHPGETMATVYHLDGDRLLLTHYCVARNQPRLQATSFEDAGATVRFSFLDGTNMPSPASGHMHDAVFRFLGPDSFTSRWSFFRDGKEEWMEEIRFVRKPGAK